jgi:hypothetical protein
VITNLSFLAFVLMLISVFHVPNTWISVGMFVAFAVELASSNHFNFMSSVCAGALLIVMCTRFFRRKRG